MDTASVTASLQAFVDAAQLTELLLRVKSGDTPVEDAVADLHAGDARRDFDDLLMPALHRYVGSTGRRLTIEYILLNEVNDHPAHAHELGKLLKGLKCNVNLIPYNQVAGVAWAGSLDAQVRGFQARLRAAGVSASSFAESTPFWTASSILTEPRSGGLSRT